MCNVPTQVDQMFSFAVFKIVFMYMCALCVFWGKAGCSFQKVWRISMACLLIKQMSEYTLGRHVWAHFSLLECVFCVQETAQGDAVHPMVWPEIHIRRIRKVIKTRKISPSLLCFITVSGQTTARSRDWGGGPVFRAEGRRTEPGLPPMGAGPPASLPSCACGGHQQLVFAPPHGPGSARIRYVLTHHVLFYLWFFMPLLFFKLHLSNF